MASPQLEKGYTRIANELLERIVFFDFTKRQYKLLLAIIRLTYGYNRKMAPMNSPQLSAMTGLDPGNTRRGVIELVQMGCVSKQHGAEGYLLGIRKDYSRWRSVSKQHARVETTRKPCQNNTAEGVSKRHANNKDSVVAVKTVKERTTSPPKGGVPSSSTQPSGFDEFWAVYPRRVGKANAKTIWARKVKTPDVQAKVMAAVHQQIEWRAKAKECGVFHPDWPHATTWLNGERWEDEEPLELREATRSGSGARAPNYEAF